jgi:hypothetical protein
MCASLVGASNRAVKRSFAAYQPTPEEIRRACAEIQSRWSADERAERWQGRKRVRWEFPFVAMRELFGDRNEDSEE